MMPSKRLSVLAHTVVGVCLCLPHATAHARAHDPVPQRAAALEQALVTALADPAIVSAGTTGDSAIVTHGNRLDDLFAGTLKVLDALSDMILTCERELLVQTYEWNDDDLAAQKLLDALRLRVARALMAPETASPWVIRILVNGTWPAENSNSQKQLADFIDSVRRADEGARHVAIELSAYTGFALGVLHGKIAICDATRGLVMTGNFRTLDGPQHDFFNMGASVSGPVAATLRADWQSARARSKPIASSASDFPDACPHGSGDAYPPSGTGTAAVLTRPSRWQPWGDARANPQNTALVALLDAAETSVEAMNPALNAPQIIDAIARAAARGVRQTLILSLNMDRWEQHHVFGGDNADAAHMLYGALLREGGPALAERVSILWPSRVPGQPAEQNDALNIHAKAALFDDACLWVGSMNWDWRSWNTSRETSVAMFGDYAPAWHAKIWNDVVRTTTPMQARDLPAWAQHESDPVYRWMRARQGPAVPTAGPR